MMGEGSGVTMSRCGDLVNFPSLILSERPDGLFPEKGFILCHVPLKSFWTSERKST